MALDDKAKKMLKIVGIGGGVIIVIALIVSASKKSKAATTSSSGTMPTNTGTNTGSVNMPVFGAPACAASFKPALDESVINSPQRFAVSQTCAAENKKRKDDLFALRSGK